jgi:pimeloyl-ACP methyl ester carboxylesterase
LNQVSISIDQDNYNGGYTQPWCVAVSWASLSFDAMDPLMLIHGTNAQSTTWELDAGGGSPVTILKGMEIPFEHRIDLVPNGSADENARLLRNALRTNATRFGVERLHLITHSKGTTDARRMLTLYGEALLNYPLRFLSLYSIGAPSQGTSLSDIAMAAGYFPHANVVFDTVLQNAVVDSVAANWASIVGLAPSDPARALQTILGMNAFNLANPKPPNAGRMYSIAGDADNNGNGKIDNFDEARLFFGPEIVQWAQVMLANDMYQALGRVLFVSLRQVGLSEWNIAAAPMRPALVPNDMVSTAESVHCAHCGFVRLADFNLNHSRLKSRVVLDRILQQIRQDYPLQPEGR